MEVQTKKKIKEIVNDNKLAKGEKVEALQDLLIETGYKFLEMHEIIEKIMEE